MIFWGIRNFQGQFFLIAAKRNFFIAKKNVGPKNFGFKTILVPKNWFRKNLVPKNFNPKNFGSKKI